MQASPAANEVGGEDDVLSRYQMRRGARADELPEGFRQDTRMHTRHVLRPTAEIVKAYLARLTDVAWAEFVVQYRALLEARFAADQSPFDELARLARENDVYLGCSCPTRANPDVRHCHTWLALEFMRERYHDLDVRMPEVKR